MQAENISEVCGYVEISNSFSGYYKERNAYFQ